MSVTPAPTNEAGFTLVELLVALMIGMLVMIALLTIVDQSLPATNRIMARVDAQQRGRTALEELEQQLHSAVCLDTGPDSSGNETYATPIISAGANQVTFYSGIVNGDAGAATNPPPVFAPQKVQYIFDPTAGTIVEHQWQGTGSIPNVQFPATATSTRTVLGRVQTVPGASGIFTTYAYDPTTEALTATTDPTKVAQIGVDFQVNGVGGAAGQVYSTAQSAAFDDLISIALPTDFTSSTTAANGPGCSL